MTTITLYHGTTKDSAEKIIKDGFLSGPVYLTPNKETAETYAANNDSDYVVFEVEVEFELLKYDSEFINGETDNWVQESLEAGSVYVDGDVSIHDAALTHYEDFEEVC